jgi:hypothetical protein
MSPDPIANDARKARRERRLGPDAICLTCAETDLRTLIFDDHHIAGRANGDVTARVCRNCHARAHEDLRDAGVNLAPPVTILDRVVAVLLAVGTFLAALGTRLVAEARVLERFIAGLDDNYLGWRTMAEAQV